jgi:GTP-binding nuclear protein Ran
MSVVDSTQNVTPIHKYKVVIIGEGGVGKTSFLKRYRTGEFEKRYIATMGVEVNPMQIHTNKGTVIFNMWDCAGQEKFQGLGDGYYIGAQATMLMFDVTNNSTYKALPGLFKCLTKTTGTIPMVVCGNKVDCENRKVKFEDITYLSKVDVQYYDVSAKSNFQLELPFLYLARQLLGDPNLELVEAPAIAPPIVSLGDTTVIGVKDDDADTSDDTDMEQQIGTFCEKLSYDIYDYADNHTKDEVTAYIDMLSQAVKKETQAYILSQKILKDTTETIHTLTPESHGNVEDQQVYKCLFTGLTRAGWFTNGLNSDPNNPLCELYVSRGKVAKTKCTLSPVWTNIPIRKWLRWRDEAIVVLYKFKHNVRKAIQFPSTVAGCEDSVLLIQLQTQLPSDVVVAPVVNMDQQIRDVIVGTNQIKLDSNANQNGDTVLSRTSRPGSISVVLDGQDPTVDVQNDSKCVAM